MASALTPTCPATVNAGQALLLLIENRSNANETYTITGITGWTEITHAGGAAVQMWAYIRQADGSEDGATVTCTASVGTAAAHRARIYTVDNVDFSGTPFEAVGTDHFPNATAISDVAVTTTLANELAFNVVGINAANNALGAMTGMTGGTWAESDYSANDSLPPQMSVQTSAMPAAGTIDGGGLSGLTSANYRIISFALKGTLPTPLTAVTGSFALTGNDTTFTAQRRMTADVAAFTLTGNAAGTAAGRQLAANQGAFTLTGNAAGGKLSAAAATGSFAVSGQAAVFHRRMAAVTGAFTLTGSAATFPMIAHAGTFVLTGHDAGLRAPHQPLLAGSGDFAIRFGALNFYIPAAELIYQPGGPGSRPSPYRRGARQRFARPGPANAECPKCGFVVAYAEIVQDWQGKWVCTDCKDERPPAIPVVPPEPQALQHPRPWKQDYSPAHRVEERVPPPLNVKPDFFS